jgi:hypothetical protein
MIKNSKVLVDANPKYSKKFDERLFEIAKEKQVSSAKTSCDTPVSKEKSATPLTDSIVISKRGTNLDMHFSKFQVQ